MLNIEVTPLDAELCQLTSIIEEWLATCNRRTQQMLRSGTIRNRNNIARAVVAHFEVGEQNRADTHTYT